MSNNYNDDPPLIGIFILGLIFLIAFISIILLDSNQKRKFINPDCWPYRYSYKAVVFYPNNNDTISGLTCTGNGVEVVSWKGSNKLRNLNGNVIIETTAPIKLIELRKISNLKKDQ